MDTVSKIAAVEAAQAWLEEHESELIEDLRTMLRIPSIEGEPEPNAPFGKECRKALDLALSLGEAWGMRTRDVEGFAGHAEFGEGSAMVMSLGHLDVVPVSDGWKHEPFGAEIDGDYIYARGAGDDKGPTMAAFYAARALKETGADLPARIRLVFGCNEESGFQCVKRYFEVEEAPTYGIAPDSGWPCYHAEKGIANLIIRAPLPSGKVTLRSLEGGTRPNIVVDRAVAVADISDSHLSEVRAKVAEYWDRNVSFELNGGKLTITATGKAAHGSTPFMGDSAIVRAFRALVELAPPEQRDEYVALMELGHPSGAGLGIHGEDEVSRDLTSNVGIVATDDGLIFTVNVRYPVTWKGTELRARCEEFLANEARGWTLASFDDSKPLYFPIDQEPVLTIVDVYRQETGDMKKPGVMGGGTYARAVPNTVSVGTGWEGDGPAHENDERIHISHPLKMAKIYAHLLYRLAHAAARK
jgi:succinyl-diaminopimelate desuccinylase